jgi:hypothetical protein
LRFSIPKGSKGRDSKKRSREGSYEPRASTSTRRAAAAAADGKIHEASRRLRGRDDDGDDSDQDASMDEDDDESSRGSSFFSIQQWCFVLALFLFFSSHVLSSSVSARTSAGTSTRRSDRGLRNDVDLDIAQMDALLKSLTKHEDAWPFLRPVTKKDVSPPLCP